MLSKDDILKANDLTVEEVQVPQWGGSVYIKSMTGTERDAFEQSITDGKKTNISNIRAKMLVRCVCDAKGVLLFNESDITQLGGKSAAALDTLFEVAQSLNGMSQSDVKDLEKNSGSGLSESSTSD